MSKKFEIKIANPILIDSVDQDTDFIPIITDDDAPIIKDSDIPDVIPVLALRNTVLFPGVVIPITVGRSKSVKLIRELNPKKKILGAISQIDAKIDEPETKDLFKVGTVAQVLKVLEMPDGSTSVILQGIRRFEVEDFIDEDPYFTARINILHDIFPHEDDREFKAIVGSIRDLSLKVIELSPNLPKEASFAIKNIESNQFLVNFICSNADIQNTEKQGLLEKNVLKERAVQLLQYLTREVQLLELKNDIQSKVKLDIDQQQREYFLHQQMKTIQDEL